MQASTVQQLPSTELCLRIVWLSDGPAPRRWSPVKVSMELWARHMGRHCVVDKIVTFWGAEFPFFSGSINLNLSTNNKQGLLMERFYMETQDGLKTIALPLFLNIFFYILLVL